MALLFFYESPLAERSRSRVDAYHILPCLQIFHIANRIIAIHLNAPYHLSHHIYNLDFRNCFR